MVGARFQDGWRIEGTLLSPPQRAYVTDPPACSIPSVWVSASTFLDLGFDLFGSRIEFRGTTKMIEIRRILLVKFGEH